MEYIIASIMLTAPLIGAVIVGFFNLKIERKIAGYIAIGFITVSFICACILLNHVYFDYFNPQSYVFYRWASIDTFEITIGLLIDRLSILMAIIVTFVSLMVHIYTLSYMAQDKASNRFFSYLNLFTFFMLALVLSDNLLQLFFGWEGVGLVSYLLIGFWYEKPTAVYANLKAFIVNRIGDFGFILGIALIFVATGSLQYSEIFTRLELLDYSSAYLAALLFFIGAMAKSAQFPLHVWLPDSMEGPTPISALIHAATMVTAGIFLVARMSPLYNIAPDILNFILIIGTITTFFMGLVGIVQNDIKRIIAYSTLSQLGLMTVALGLGLYNLAIYHLLTHAFFKALLFLGAGSVIHALHHEQDITKMGGLRNKMPITFFCMLIGSLALVGFPGFAGFYSKDLIIHSLHLHPSSIAAVSYYFVITGVIITALYSFRLLFIVFFGTERYSSDIHPHESPKTITIPLILLAIPSVFIGHVLFSSLAEPEFLKNAISISPALHELTTITWVSLYTHLFINSAFYFVILGMFLSWYFFSYNLALTETIKNKYSYLHKLLLNKFYLDEFNHFALVRPTLVFSNWLWKKVDVAIIDGLMVNASSKLFEIVGSKIRRIQTGHINHYLYIFIFSMTLIVGAIIIKST